MIHKLEKLYNYMDREYDNAARQYGFICRGCSDNCCETLFYHHTNIERIYLLHGFNALKKNQKIIIKDKAQEIINKIKNSDCKGEKIRLMCPLNDDDRCILYRYRPMICRLHGIPHELRRGYQTKDINPGCDYFHKNFGTKRKNYYTFDRTPVYIKMSQLENILKQQTGNREKIKMTVADMIISHDEAIFFK